MDSTIVFGALGFVAALAGLVPAYFHFITGRASLPAYFDVAVSLRDASKSLRSLSSAILDLAQVESIALATPLAIPGLPANCQRLLVVKHKSVLGRPRVSAVTDQDGKRREVVLHYLEHEAELVRYSESARLLVVSGTRSGDSSNNGKLWSLGVVDLKNMKAQNLCLYAEYGALSVEDPFEVLALHIRSAKSISADVRLSCFKLETASGESVYFGGRTLSYDKEDEVIGAPIGFKTTITVGLSSALRIESLSSAADAENSPTPMLFPAFEKRKLAV